MGRLAARLVAALAAVLASAAVALDASESAVRTLPLAKTGLTEVFVGGGTLGVAWRPARAYRPAWAGQVNRLGFRYNRYSDGSGYAFMPLRAAAAAAGAVACAAGYLGWRPRRGGRRRDGDAGPQCPHCGYDLRASPDRCPECGTPAG